MANFVIKSFKGGFSDYDDKGVEGSFKSGKNLNIRKRADTLSCNQALYDITPPAEGFNTLIDWFVPASDGSIYGFSRNGRIYKFDSSMVCTLVYTDTDGDIRGAWEWGVANGKRYLFWATATKLHSKEIPGLANWTDIDADIVTSSGTQTYPKTDLTNTPSHMMKAIGGGIASLVICNDDTFAYIDYKGLYSNNGFIFMPGHRAKLVMQREKVAIFGAVSRNQLFSSELYSWDGLAIQAGEETLNKWDNSKPLPLKDIAAMIDTEINMLVDDKGQVFNSNFVTDLPIFVFPDNGKVSAGGVTNEEYLAYFGVWGNGAKTGIYSYGRKFKNANRVLNLEYALTADEIGGIVRAGDNLLISYKNGANYGVKNIDPANKAQAVYETVDLWQPAKIGFQKIAKWNTIVLTTAPLPASCSIEVNFKLNKNGNFLVSNMQGGATAFNTTGAQEAVFYVGDLGKVQELQVVLNPNGNNTPEVYRIEPHFMY